MTKRTYGSRGLTLEDFDPALDLADTTAEMALAAHIRELQAENVKLKDERREFELEIGRLRAGRGNLAVRVANRLEPYIKPSVVSAIVEQEMNK